MALQVRRTRISRDLQFTVLLKPLLEMRMPWQHIAGNGQDVRVPGIFLGFCVAGCHDASLLILVIGHLIADKAVGLVNEHIQDQIPRLLREFVPKEPCCLSALCGPESALPLVAPPFFSAVGLMVPSHRRNEFFGETQRVLLADARDLRRTDAEAQRHGKHKSLMGDGTYVLFLASAKFVVSPRLLREMLHIVAPRIEGIFAAMLQDLARLDTDGILWLTLAPLRCLDLLYLDCGLGACWQKGKRKDGRENSGQS